MKQPRVLAELLKEYFQYSPEPFAIEFRKHFNIQPPNFDLLTDEQIDERIEQAFLHDWLDNQDVMQTLHISPRTLQTLRSNGILPFSRIGNKLYYRRQDIERLLNNNYSRNKNESHGKP